MTLRPHAIEIDGGILKSTTVYDAKGSHPVYQGIGDYHFFVDLIEEDGCRIGAWAQDSRCQIRGVGQAEEGAR